ncbi:MAG: BON domain-containing protein [Casimicrobiaceae bacterium]
MIRMVAHVTLIALAAVTLLSACVPLLLAAGAGGAALVVADRRSAGTQVDDQAIELKIANQARTQYGERLHLNVTSYNGVVLLTGEVPDQATGLAIGNMARGTLKVRTVQNELTVGGTTELGERTRDTYLTSVVKSRFLDGSRFPANAVKVVTEKGVVYLMGIVSREEGEAAAQIASTTSGVARVVKVFEYRS